MQAFRRAATVVSAFDGEELAELVRTGRLRNLKGIGDATFRVVQEALAGEVPGYLRRLEVEGEAARAEREASAEATPEANALRAAIVGDCHTHSDWSDGGSPIREMAEAAREVGHQWLALTDHSPSLKVANGLTRERLARQLDEVAEVNEALAPFRIFTGVEVDILLDGSLDHDDETLSRLDVVVASVHSKLRMERDEMTKRMLRAVRHPHVDVLGHCTGRLVTGRGRPESTFDAEAVFEACAESGTAVEVNSRPERLDPPMRLLRMAVDAGCLLAVDSDAHAPGQLDWQPNGCERVAAIGVDHDRVVTTWPAERLLAWTRP